MSAPITNYQISNGSDLNTIFAPLYLDGTKNLINISKLSGSSPVPTINTIFYDASYSYVELNALSTIYGLTINTNILPSDEFNIIVVGGGGSGINGSGTRESGGGGGGGVGAINFNLNGLSIGTQFYAEIGQGGSVNTSGSNTSIFNLITQTVFMQATGGAVGNQNTPDKNPLRANGGIVLGSAITNSSYFGDLLATGNIYNQGGIGGLGSDRQKGQPFFAFLPNIYLTPWAVELRFSGGGGGSYFESGGNSDGGKGGNADGGVGLLGSVENKGQPGQCPGAGGGAGGGVNGNGQAGGAGSNGCIYIYWKTRT